MADTLKRVESFAFDSKADGYDDDGYPIYDRAVGASVLRDAFKQFFSDGIFGTPADALMVTKGTGLSVSLAAGTFIINGAIATVQEPLTLKLADSAPQGRTPYGIMLRYDENSTYRSCYIRVATGTPSSSPVAPSPETGTAGVKEYRIGWVDVPSGSTDLSGATVHDERGTSCPYAAPFESIDIAAFFADLQTKGDEVFRSFMTFLDANYELVESAIDGTTAGKLQNQINELKITLPNTTFWDYVSGDSSTTEGDKHATVENIRYFRQQNKVKFLNDEVFVEQMSSPTTQYGDYAVSLSNLRAMEGDRGLPDIPPLSAVDWATIGIAGGSLRFNPGLKDEFYSKYSNLVGQTKSIDIRGYGTFSFKLIGMCRDSDREANPVGFTFACASIVTTHVMNSSNTTSGGWGSCSMRDWLQGAFLVSFPKAVSGAIREVAKKNTSGYGSTTYDTVWLLSQTEVGLTTGDSEGAKYACFVDNASRIKKNASGSAGNWWLRSVQNSSYFRGVNSDGSLYYGSDNYEYGVVPCFCI